MHILHRPDVLTRMRRPRRDIGYDFSSSTRRRLRNVAPRGRRYRRRRRIKADRRCA